MPPLCSLTHSFRGAFRLLPIAIPTLLSTLCATTTLISAAHAAPSPGQGGTGGNNGGTVGATPHDSYSSSVGVLGCKINTNRVAYWPDPVDCNNICVSLSYGNRKLHLLRVDQSAGAYDVSYDAWNYLYSGYGAAEKPVAGGAVSMKYENVDASHCADLIHGDDAKLPLSAANSMNFLSSCLDQSSSYVAKNYVLYNVLDPLCSLGYDEPCRLDWPNGNQAACPHILGMPARLRGAPVYNLRYPTGQKVLASSTGETEVGDESLARSRARLRAAALPWIVAALVLVLAACC
ncbi:hypothetical protein RJ55_06934 [Drechmeria coniospora]|nr:hypothetical protein RJ55_06934 [Drechmeria coniospora]